MSRFLLKKATENLVIEVGGQERTGRELTTFLEKLIELEKVDREIARLSEEVAALPKRVEAIEHRLADDKAAVEQAKAAIKNNDAGRRKLEADIQGFQRSDA